MSNTKVTIAGVALGAIAGLAVGSGFTFWMIRGGSFAASNPAPVIEKASASSAAQSPPPQIPLGEANAQSTGVFINQKELTGRQLESLHATYGAVPPQGKYWYDSRSGLYGSWGFEAAGYIRPGHDFGPLPANASRGNTGTFINGREINLTEAAFFQRLFGVVYQGSFWLDGTTGNLGIEGNPTPLANLVAAMRQAQQQNGAAGGYTWRDGSGATVGSEGNCTFAAIPGAPVYSTPGCG